MSLSNAAVVTAPSSIAPTGGTTLTFSSFGTSPGGIVIAVPADTDSRLRRSITFTVTPPRPAPTSPSGYTQQRCKAIFKRPIITASGKYTVNTLEVSLATDVEATDAVKQEILDIGAQLLFDSDFIQFWKSQNLT